jgi:3-oxoacyl-[acyl-carrier-protein] synthase III
MNVYINDIGIYLPGEGVSNEEIEAVLGKIDNIPSRAKRIVLKNNGIQTRYYAIDRESGALTHTNAQLVAEAVRALSPHEGFTPDAIECLCCGTTSPDLLFPGHALMVLGELGLPPVEAVSTAGICISGMTAFKYAYMNVATGMSANAVATGSELSSSFMRSRFFGNGQPRDESIGKKPIVGFDTDFLRWMLSDGAGAAYLASRPNETGPSLRVDWIDYLSFAGELDTCMFGGGVKTEDGCVVGWRQVEDLEQANPRELMAVHQDIRLLDGTIVATMERALAASIEKHDLKAEAVDWFIPHYSSTYFRPKFFEALERMGFTIPYERWFTNLIQTGNTGSAAIYIILAELLKSGRLEKGQKLLCFIPESGRFSHCFMQLTVCG